MHIIRCCVSISVTEIQSYGQREKVRCVLNWIFPYGVWSDFINFQTFFFSFNSIDRYLRFDLMFFSSEIQDMFSTMLSGGGSGGNRRATSLGKGHLSQAAAARLARTSSWNDGLDGAGNPSTITASMPTTSTSSNSTAGQHHSILRVTFFSIYLFLQHKGLGVVNAPVINLDKSPESSFVVFLFWRFTDSRWNERVNNPANQLLDFKKFYFFPSPNRNISWLAFFFCKFFTFHYKSNEPITCGNIIKTFVSKVWVDWIDCNCCAKENYIKVL